MENNANYANKDINVKSTISADPSEREVLLTIRNLKKSFGSNEVLHNISTEFRKGEVTAIIGPSGCGKSTFLRCLNLLERPDSGEIWFEGKNLLDRSTNINKMREQLGMVFQSFNLFPNMNILENIMLGPVKLLGISREQAEQTAMQLLEKVGLADKAKAYSPSLSGGQKQRIAIARALAMKPKLILFDEPTSALDPEMVGEVLNLMQELAAEGMTMIVVTHEMGFAQNVANRAIFINEGVIQEDEKPAEFFGNPKNPRLRDFLSKVK